LDAGIGSSAIRVINEAKGTAMTDTKNPEALLWDELDGAHVVMLGAQGAGSHMQPMSPFAEPGSKTVWFFSSRQTDLVKAAEAAPVPSQMCLVGDDRDFFACVNGTISVDTDPEKVAKYWSTVVAAWFEKGKEDPDLAMLSFKPQDAAIWSSTDSAIRFGWEIAKANLTGGKPDVGHHTVIRIGGGLAA
jgi:general stress protein 26